MGKTYLCPRVLRGSLCYVMEGLCVAEEAFGSRSFLHEVSECFSQVLSGVQDVMIFSQPGFKTKCLQQLHAGQNHVDAGIDAETEKENTYWETTVCWGTGETIQ